MLLWSVVLAAHVRPALADGPKEYKGFALKKIHEPYSGLKVWEYEHQKSGLRVILTPQKKSTVTAYVTAFNVGSRFEEKGKTGLAHLFEHMMFRGTETFPKPFETLANWGNSFNAYTSQDMTVYYEMVPSELLKNVVQFEAERMRNLLITPQGFQQERGAVFSERKMSVEDSPVGRMFWELNLLAFQKHPYRVSPIGFQKDLDAATFEGALAFYQKYYAPNRAVVSIAGGLEIKDVLGEMDTRYGSFERVEVKEPETVVEPPIKGVRRKVVKLKTENALVGEAVRGLSYSDPDAAAELLMCVLLADGEIGYLDGALVEKGLAQRVSASCSPSKEAGLSRVVVAGNPGIDPLKLEESYLASLSGFKKWLTKERVENLKLYFVASQLARLRNPDDLAESFATSAVLSGDPMNSSVENLKKIQLVTYEDVLRRFDLRMKSGKARVLVQPAKVSDPITAN